MQQVIPAPSNVQLFVPHLDDVVRRSGRDLNYRQKIFVRFLNLFPELEEMGVCEGHRLPGVRQPRGRGGDEPAV